MNPKRQLAFARITSNLILGGTTFGALIALMRIWINDREHNGRERG